MSSDKSIVAYILQAVNWLLNLLPFNGDKLKIGAVVELACQLHREFPELDWLAFLDARLAALGVPLIVIGIIHKILKKLEEQILPC